MKATGQYFPVVLFIMLYKAVLTFESVDEVLSVTIEMKATEQHFPVVLLCCTVKTFESVDVILESDHSTGGEAAQLLQHHHGDIYGTVQNTMQPLDAIKKSSSKLRFKVFMKKMFRSNGKPYNFEKSQIFDNRYPENQRASLRIV